MTNKTDDLNELITVLEDGREFYEEARDQVEDRGLKTLFGQMAQAKRLISAELKRIVRFKGEEPEEGSFAGSLRKLYAKIRVGLASDQSAQYVSQLEEFEDKILAKFEDQSKNADSLEVRAIAAKYLPELRRHHDQMRALENALS
ncbi:MAG: PA2169 family four-helix-bundle protein [Wenzhouxiangella sp.]